MSPSIHVHHEKPVRMPHGQVGQKTVIFSPPDVELRNAADSALNGRSTRNRDGGESCVRGGAFDQSTVTFKIHHDKLESACCYIAHSSTFSV